MDGAALTGSSESVASNRPQGDDDTPAGGRQWGRYLGALAGAGTLLVAIWGAVTGTIAWTENRAISVDLAAGTDFGFQSAGTIGIGVDYIRLSLVNTSSRSVNLVRAEVLLNGTPVGAVYNVIPGGGPGVPGQTVNPTPLPFSVGASDSATLQMSWAKFQTAEPLLTSELAVPIAQRNMALRVTLEPGGVRTVIIHTGEVPTSLGPWSAYVIVQHDRAKTILFLPNSISSGSALATLQVWQADPRKRGPVLVDSRPAGWGVPAYFPITSLPPGGYVFSVSSGGQAIATGSLYTECIGKDGGYTATACASGNVTAFTPYRVSPYPSGLLPVGPTGK
jgi:hypothetical protein